MKSILFSNWTFRRLLFLIIGSLIIIDSIQNSEWMGIIFGSYFVVLSIFQLGCASGNCTVPLAKENLNSQNEVLIEEVKLKN